MFVSPKTFIFFKNLKLAKISLKHNFKKRYVVFYAVLAEVVYIAKLTNK